MIIDKMNFPIYGIMILVSLIVGIIFNYIYLKENKIEKRHILLFMLMLIVYSIFGGIMLNRIITSNFNASNIGLSSYGGAIGIIISSIIFEKMCPKNGVFIKSSIISLPLIYSISKLACFFAGCCYGIPYNGKFSVTYTFGLNIPVLPIQMIETIIFMIVFLMCLFLKKNIIEITIILSALSKFMLDFFRYSHLKEYISINQIISIIFIIIGIVFMIKNNTRSLYEKRKF